MFVIGGESLIDLVSAPRGADGTIHMQAHQGGSPYNCAIALAKLGNDTGYLCPISRDGFGDFLMEPLDGAQVRVLLGERVFEPTTLAVVTLNARGQAQYEFYRGAERALDKDQLVTALPGNLEVFQIGGFCPIEPEDAAIWLDVAKEAATRGAVLSMDPNLRPSLVADFDAYKTRLEQFFDLVQIVKLSTEDLEALDPEMDVEAHVRALLARANCELVIVTDGENGSRAFVADAEGVAGIYSPPIFGDTVGAGDSLMAGILTFLQNGHWLKNLGSLDEALLGEMLRYGAVVSGLNCAEKGCHPPTRAQVTEVLATL